MKRRVWSLLLAAALTVGLFAGLTVPARAAGDVSPAVLYDQVSVINAGDWAMVAGQDHVLWMYDGKKNWSAQSMMTDVHRISLRQQGLTHEIYVLKTDGSLWYILEKTYEGNDRTLRFSQPVRIMSNVKEISSQSALTTDGTVYALSGSQAEPTGERGVAAIAANSCWGKEEIRGEPIPCADPDTFYIGHGACLVLSKSGDLWSWGETHSGGVGIPLNNNYYVNYSNIWFPMGNYSPGWRSAPICFVSAPARILTNVKTVWVDDKAFYAEKRDGTLWMWGDGAPVEVYFNGTGFTEEVREPKDQTGWAPRQVAYPPSWDMDLGNLRLCFYPDGRLILNQGTDKIRLKNWASDPGNATPFTDVKSSAYYYDAVKWALDQGVTTGITATSFGPDKTVTRGQCVTFLWRAMGQPEPAGKDNPFLDVKTSDYFYKAVLWAGEKGITNGVDASHFNPGGTLSTAHILTFLYRALGQGSDGWYEEAGAWAQKAGLLTGTGAHAVSTENCPRANVVTFLYRQLR